MMYRSLLTLLPVAVAGAIAGKATFYGGNVQGGTCSFSTYTLPAGIYGTALGGAQWANSAHCGRCVSVEGPNRTTIKAMIVDKCPECEQDHLDLFEEGFVQIGDRSAGIIDITWDFVDCAITSPLQVHVKSGSSKFWFSAQIVNANAGVSDLQVSTNAGKTWQSGLTRQPYNFFEKSSGFGTDSVWVKAIGINGKSVIVHNVPVAGDTLVTGISNL